MMQASAMVRPARWNSPVGSPGTDEATSAAPMAADATTAERRPGNVVTGIAAMAA
jgi:hypothetical protein